MCVCVCVCAFGFQRHVSEKRGDKGRAGVSAGGGASTKKNQKTKVPEKAASSATGRPSRGQSCVEFMQGLGFRLQGLG